MSGLEHLARIQAAEAARHDEYVNDLPREILIAIAKDLGPRMASNRKDPEQRWTMAHKAAIGRRILREKITA